MGQTDPGLESREVVETITKQRHTTVVSGIVFILLFALVLFLPFKHTHTEGSYSGIFGTVHQGVTKDEYFSGFQEIYVLVLSVFYFVSIVLFLLARKRITMIFSVICSGLNLLSLPLIYFMITFHLQFFGPPTRINAGFGFYVLTLLDVTLLIYLVVMTRKFPKSESREVTQDLLDL